MTELPKADWNIAVSPHTKAIDHHSCLEKIQPCSGHVLWRIMNLDFDHLVVRDHVMPLDEYRSLVFPNWIRAYCKNCAMLTTCKRTRTMPISLSRDIRITGRNRIIHSLRLYYVVNTDGWVPHSNESNHFTKLAPIHSTFRFWMFVLSNAFLIISRNQTVLI